jgi:two-component system cell cycle response regulator CtrA
MSLESDYVATLEAENEELREKVLQLEEMLGLAFDAPPVLELTGKEAKVFGFLMKVPMATKQAIMNALYFDRIDKEPEIKIVDVFICKLRAKLSPHQLAIETVWGQGYCMPAETKARAQQLIEQFQGMQAAE